jgi:hypothetical protein
MSVTPYLDTVLNRNQIPLGLTTSTPHGSFVHTSRQRYGSCLPDKMCGLRFGLSFYFNEKLLGFGSLTLALKHANVTIGYNPSLLVQKMNRRVLANLVLKVILNEDLQLFQFQPRMKEYKYSRLVPVQKLIQAKLSRKVIQSICEINSLDPNPTRR